MITLFLCIYQGMTFYTTLNLEAVTVLVFLGNGPNGTSSPLALNQPTMVKNSEIRKKNQKLVDKILDQLERQYPTKSERFLHLITSGDGKISGQVGSGGDTRNRKEEVRCLAIDSLVKALKNNKVRLLETIFSKYYYLTHVFV